MDKNVIVRIPPKHEQLLDELSRTFGQTKSAVVRAALDLMAIQYEEYLKKNKNKPNINS
jgi:predicted DNA-binding protein